MGSFMSPRTTAEPAVKKQAVYDAIQLHITLKVNVLRPKAVTTAGPYHWAGDLCSQILRAKPL